MKKLISIYCLAYLVLLVFVVALLCIYSKLELHLMLNAIHMRLLDTFFKYYSMMAEGPIYALALLSLLVLAALGAYSRVYLSQHFLSDVCVGSLIGFTTPCLYFLFAGNRILKLKTNDTDSHDETTSEATATA